MSHLALVLVALLIAPGIAAPAYALTAPAPTWGVEFPNLQLPTGMPYDFEVSGPGGAFFNVSLSYAPYNSTVPFFVQTYQLPQSGGEAYDNLSLNSSRWNVGTLQLEVGVLMPPFVLAYHVVYTIPAVNLTPLEDELEGVEIEELILQERQQHEAWTLNTLQGQVETLFWVGFGETLYIALILVFTREPVKANRLVRRFLLNPLRAAFTALPYWKPYEHMPKPEPEPAGGTAVLVGDTWAGGRRLVFRRGLPELDLDLERFR